MLYAGDGSESHISTEKANGMPEQLAKCELIEYLKSGKTNAGHGAVDDIFSDNFMLSDVAPRASSKLVIVFSPSNSIGILLHAGTSLDEMIGG